MKRWRDFLKRAKDAWLVLGGKETIHAWPFADLPPTHVHHNPPPDKVLAVVCHLGAQYEPSRIDIAVRVKGEQFMLKEEFHSRYLSDERYLVFWCEHTWEKLVRQCDVRVSLRPHFQMMVQAAIEEPNPIPISHKLYELRQAGEDV